MKLEIITPERTIFQGDVVSVTLPGAAGMFQVLENHAPVISLLQKGKLTFVHKDKEVTELLIEDGFAEINKNRVTVCLDSIIEEV